MTGQGSRIRSCSLLAPLLGVLLLGGCGARLGPYAARNVDRGVSISPSFMVRVFRTEEAGAADIYLTDLPRDRLRPGTPLNGVSGHLVRVSLLMRPVPGKTPVDATAINAAVTHIVVADGQIGVYAGGGFFSVSGRPEAAVLEGRFRGGSLRLIGATAEFADLLGAGEILGSVSASRDAPLAGLLRARVDELVQRAGARQP